MSEYRGRSTTRSSQSINLERQKLNLQEAHTFLSTPGSVLAERADTFASPFETPHQIHPNEALEVKFPVSLSLSAILDGTDAKLGLHLKSSLAQLGFTFADFPKEVHSGVCSLQLLNDGPNEIILPAGRALPLGNLYGYTEQLPLTQEQGEAELQIMRAANNRNSGRDNGFAVIEVTKDQFLLGIQMAQILVYPFQGRTITLDDQFPRGTQRAKLHEVLGIERVDFPASGATAADIQRIVKKYSFHDGSFNPYLLMQTAGPIHYPKNTGVLMRGGCVINKDDKGNVRQEIIITFPHGPSNLGQYRSHNPGSRDPEHPLIGEFGFYTSSVLEYMAKGYEIFMTALPVRLAWLNNGHFCK